jgi:hypothetical protein
MDALHVISSEFPSQPLSESTAAHPLLHSRITELQVHTLLGLDFSDHHVWTQTEIRNRLHSAAKALNFTAEGIYPNRLSEDGCFSHHPYIHQPKRA